ncbi:MAG: AbrB/MazE/SpoVT family DNA-binding domain-containing protein [Acidobacteriota bacterium]
MQTRIHTWGNSLALRIPKPFAEHLGLKKNSRVVLMIEEDRIAISKPASPPVTLEELLSRATKKNLHRETETGKAQGKEVW